jgi:hypothetical protein
MYQTAVGERTGVVDCPSVVGVEKSLEVVVGHLMAAREAVCTWEYHKAVEVAHLSERMVRTVLHYL